MIATEFFNKALEGMKNEEVLDLYWYALDESCPLAMINLNSRITYFNERLTELTGHSSEDAHCALSKLLHLSSHGKEFVGKLTEQIRSGKAWKKKVCLRHKDGHPVCFKASFFPSPGDDPSRQHLLIFLPEQNIPTEKKALPEPVVERFSSMAHDLRNPLYNISGLCGLLLETPLNDNQLEYVTKIKDSSALLSGMLDEFLQSFIKGREEHIAYSGSFNLRKTIENFPALFFQKASALGIATWLEADEDLPEKVFGDESQLKKLIQHITDFLFSRSGLRSVRLSALREDTENKICDVSFFFLGQYSTPAEIEVSRKDASVDDPDQWLKDTREKIAALNGKVMLEENSNKAFYLHFILPFRFSPLPEPRVLTPAEEEPAPELPADARILVAEDVELNQLVMKHQLQKIGLEADFVRTGFNVLEQLRAYTYDLILMDVQMPGMNGLQTIEVIRSDASKPWHQIPIIGITASIGENARQKCIRAGADDFVPKPYNLDDLKQKLKKLIAEYRQKLNSTKVKPPKETVMTTTEKYFDLSYLEEISEGDRDFSATMISYFIDNTPPVMENLEKKVQEQDWDEVRQIAHKLKPQVVYMGIHQVADDVEKVEHLAQHRENLHEIPGLVEKTAIIISKSIAQLEEELKHFI
jgi:CheY-like chemotaxis protein/HPt (histidine-containing phosphotransfer) domain-containing protein